MVKHRHSQRGLTLLGLLFFGSLLAFVGIIAAQAFPTYVEFVAIERAVKKASVANTPNEVRVMFDKSSSIDNIETITGKDLKISQNGDKISISFAYQREIHLFGPAFLVMKYEGSSR